MKITFDETPKQLFIEFPNPEGFGDLERFVGKNIARKEEDWIVPLTAPRFEWVRGIWTCLANVNGMLCAIQLDVRRVEV